MQSLFLLLRVSHVAHFSTSRRASMIDFVYCSSFACAVITFYANNYFGSSVVHVWKSCVHFIWRLRSFRPFRFLFVLYLCTICCTCREALWSTTEADTLEDTFPSTTLMGGMYVSFGSQFSAVSKQNFASARLRSTRLAWHTFAPLQNSTAKHDFVQIFGFRSEFYKRLLFKSFSTIRFLFENAFAIWWNNTIIWTYL